MRESNPRRELFAYLLLLLILSAGVIWIRIATVRETYRFVQSEKQLKTTRQEIQALRLRWARLTTPQKLMHVARDLNLQPPALNQVVKYAKVKPKG